ncbi:MAG: efflux RND transporter periplasmic adaptor subunit [Pseudomonadota bacterium]
MHRSLSLSAAALLLIAAGCSGSKADDEAATAARPVDVAAVERGDIARTVVYAADLEAWSEVQVYSRVADRVLSLPLHDGDEVRAGQRLALIKRDALDKGIEQVSAQIEALDIQIRTQTQDLARSKELLAGGVITQQIFDQASAGLEATQAQRRALQASLDQIGINAGDAAVVAPIAGVVANLALDLGDTASPQLPLCSVLQVDPLKIELDMAECDAQQVQPGDEVRLTVRAWPEETFTGTVTRVYPYLDAVTRTNTVEVRVPNPVGEDGLRRLKPGMFGRAELTVDRRTDAVLAPAQAMLLDPVLLAQDSKEGELRKAFVVGGDGLAHERQLTLGIRSGRLYEVRAGLDAGDRVVIRGQHSLTDGQAVRIPEETL